MKTGTVVEGLLREDGLEPSTALARVFTDDADHEIVQRRLGLFYGILGVIVLGVFVVALIASAIVIPERFWELHLSKQKALHLLLGVGLTIFGLYCRRARLLPRWLLSTTDVVGSLKLVSLTGAMVLTAPKGLDNAFIVLIPLMLIVCLRAAIVPSPPRWTALVATAAALPAPPTCYFAAKTVASTEFPLSMVLVFATTWSVSAVVAAFVISKVVYGLRSEVKKAMRLGQYTLEDKIGEGGMGVVYRARHALLRRPTAIKLLSADRTEQQDVRRFEREVQLTSMLTHPNTVAVYDFGHTRSGIFYYAMEHLDGMSLHDLVERDGPQSAGRVVHILTQVAGALGEAHAVGLVHRDVKPENIFLCERGGIPDFVKVLDFGLVKHAGVTDPTLSHVGAIAGTPHYMAPESITDPDAVDARVDIYALGAVGYFLLTGDPPFGGNSLVEVCSHHLHTDPEPIAERLGSGAEVPAQLEEVIMKCLAKSKDDRPSASELADLLRACGVSGWDVGAARRWWREQKAARSEKKKARAKVGAPARA